MAPRQHTLHLEGYLHALIRRYVFEQVLQPAFQLRLIPKRANCKCVVGQAYFQISSL